MNTTNAAPFRVGITPDVLQSNGQPIFGHEVFDILNQPGIEWEYMTSTPEISPEQVERYDAICAMLTRFTPDSLKTTHPRLKLIARFGVGYDTIDVPSCEKAGILLTIAPDGVRRPVAVSAITFMLMLAHKVGIKDRLTRAGRWAEKSDHIGTGLTGRVLGSIGVGNIGAEMFRLARPFDMHFMAHDPYADKGLMASLGVELVDLETLFARSDFLTINCPLNSETRGLVNGRLLALMKNTSYLINTARGPIVDEAALYAALVSHQIAGAGLDVFEVEPTPADNPLLQLDNVVVTPHGICFTDECMQSLAASAFRAVVDVMNGRRPPFVVNA
ncbi:hydroxyacid dehydrogenase [Limnohabitans sp. Rim8]|uniref:hydroxyacid dehydrogenase n=1 Tax=Limnohabitans sp. Rim8 TaxID=1100718 RepID=UPI0025D31A7F|nr:hydroxyacid dehydrogenase [Limnohabitans sp. Rim8]